MMKLKLLALVASCGLLGCAASAEARGHTWVSGGISVTPSTCYVQEQYVAAYPYYYYPYGVTTYYPGCGYCRQTVYSPYVYGPVHHHVEHHHCHPRTTFSIGVGFRN